MCKLTVLGVTATPRKGKAGWVVNAKCKSPDDKPRWMPVGHLSPVEFENRREKVLQLIEQKAQSFASQSSTGSSDTNHGEKDNTGKTSPPAALLNAPQPRATTTFQTEESIARQIQSIKNKGKSNNMYGRNPSKGNSRMLCVKRNGSRYYRRTLRNIKRKNKKFRDNLKSKKRTLEIQAWEQRVNYMTDQIERLQAAYKGNVLSVYRSHDPEEDETIAYGDTELDRISQFQAQRLRQQCLAVIRFYQLIIENGESFSSELCGQAAANSAGAWVKQGETVVKWEKEYRNNDNHFLECMKGKHNRNLVTCNEEFKVECLDFVKTHGKPKGKPNMTIADFLAHLNGEILPKYAEEYKLSLPLSWETARSYLGRLGVKYNSSTTGLYFDHHQRADVVQYRDEVFIPEFNKHLKQTYFWYSMPLQRSIAFSESAGSDFEPGDLLHAEQIDMPLAFCHTPGTGQKYSEIDSECLTSCKCTPAPWKWVQPFIA